MSLEPPLFSIIIPTINRPVQLAHCLRSIMEMEYPCDRFEVIVVDDGSRSPPEGIIKCVEQSIPITLLLQSHGGPAKARNKGAWHAHGRFLVFLDDDCLPPRTWLQRLNSSLLSRTARAVGGGALNGLRNNPYTVASQLLVTYFLDYYNSDPKNVRFLPSNNLAVPADLFRAAGGFDESFLFAGGEDREFCSRWLKHGYHLVYAPETTVWHIHPLRLKTFLIQHYHYGRGAWHLRSVTDPFKGNTFSFETAGFYGKIFFLAARPPLRRKRIVISMLLGLSQIATAAGYLLEKLRPNRSRGCPA